MYKRQPECRLKWDSFSDKAGGRTFASFIQRAQKHPKYKDPKPQGSGDESDKAQEIRELFQDLYELLKSDHPEDYAKVIQKRGQLLSRRLNRDEIQRRLLLMVAKEHSLRIGEGGDVTPRHRGLHTPPTASGSYTPLVPGFTHKGKDTLLFGSSGAGKTLAALGLSTPQRQVTRHSSTWSTERLLKIVERLSGSAVMAVKVLTPWCGTTAES